AITATADQSIDATVGAASVVIAGGKNGLGLGGSGVDSTNTIGVAVEASISGDTGGGQTGISADSITVSATDESSIVAKAGAAAVAAALSSKNSVTLAIGVSLAENVISNNVNAFIKDASLVNTGGGNLVLTADDNSAIDADAVAVAVSVALGGSKSLAISGGGVEATNVILTKTNAYIEDSRIGTVATPVGNVDLNAESTSAINAVVGAVAASISVAGDSPGLGLAVGAAVARNYIGWDPSAVSIAPDYWSTATPSQLDPGTLVQISSGPLSGEIFEYIGNVLTDGDPNTSGDQAIDLSTQSYSDGSSWRHASLGSSPAEVQTRILDSSVQALGDLTLDAIGNQIVDALVFAGAMAVSGGGKTGVGVSGAGVFAENRISSLVTAAIVGDGAIAEFDGIHAAAVALSANDSSVINSVAAAASLAASFAKTGVAISVGLSIAENEVANQVSAYMDGLDEGLTTLDAGNVSITATSENDYLFELELANAITASSLDDAAEAEQGDKFTTDRQGDNATLAALRTAFANNAEVLTDEQGLLFNAMYTSDHAELVDVHHGMTVTLSEENGNGGVSGTTYEYVGAERDDVILAGENYLSSDWIVYEPLSLSVVEEGHRWSLVAPDGRTYQLEKQGSKLVVGRKTISAVSAAASLSAGIGKTGIAISGAGAVSQNVVLSSVNAYVNASQLGTGVSNIGSLGLAARSDSSIEALVLAASLAVAAGQTGVGLSIGVALSENYIGWKPGENVQSVPAQVQAYLRDSILHGAGALIIDAVSNQSIDAIVVAGSAALAGGSTGIALGGSGVNAINRIGVDVKAFVDGDGAGEDQGIHSADIALHAQDSSSINSIAAGVAVGISLAGSTALSLSIGVSLSENLITSNIAAYVTNAAVVDTDGGNISITSSDQSEIQAIVVAAAVSASLGGSTGIALAGGGADATNIILSTNNAYISGSAIGSLGNAVGAVNVAAGSLASIDAFVGAVAVSLSIGGGGAGIAAAIGIGLARNYIGWDPHAASPSADYGSHDNPAQLTAGKTVTIVSGPMSGEVFEYVGSTIADGDKSVDGNQAVDLSTQNYSDTSLWRSISLGSNPAEVQARILDSSVQASGALTISAVSEQSIDAVVVAAAVALAGGGAAGVGISGAGVSADNRIQSLVTASIIGDGANTATDGITAGSVSMRADDASVINAIAGAAAIAASFGGTGGVSVSIGVSLAYNEVSNQVAAYLSNADEGVFTVGGGDIDISAASLGDHLFDLPITSSISASKLDDASEEDDDENRIADLQQDYQTLTALRNAFAGAGEVLPIQQTVATESMYESDFDDAVDLAEGTTVKVVDGEATGGTPGRVYRFIGADRDDVSLSVENYASSDWLLVEPLKLTALEKGELWTLLSPSGRTYVLEKVGSNLVVGRDTINAISAAAAISAGFGGAGGLAVSGAGAVSQNVILSKVNAFGENSILGNSDQQVGAVVIDARSDSTINSMVVAASLAIGGGGAAGVGVSIGVAIAENLVGWKASESVQSDSSEVQAYLRQTSIHSTESVTLDAIANQKIKSVVIAGSVAIGVGGAAGLGAAGSGVDVENRIGATVRAFIDGNSTAGVIASDVSILAEDTSSIDAFALAASVAASVGGAAGLSVAIGVSLAENVITTQVEASISNAKHVTTTSGEIVVSAQQTASIDALAIAASVALGFGGAAGIAVSGAGADAKNLIRTNTKAFATDSKLTSAGDVTVRADNEANLTANIYTLSAAIAVGGAAGFGASIGVGLARNIIGWDSNPVTTYDYTSDLQSAVLTSGKRVKIGDGVRGGDVYEYINVTGQTNVNLLEEDYGDKEYWKRVDLTRDAMEVTSYLLNTSVDAVGALSVTADATGTIDAEVLAGSVAAAGGLLGAAISGVGVGAENRIAAKIDARVDGDGIIGSSVQGIEASEIEILANDESSILARTGAASIAAGFGVVGAAISVGVAMALNEIDNEINAAITSANDSIRTETGDITVRATEAATISSLTQAASVAVGGGAVGIGISGAGAVAVNVVLSDVSAYIIGSRVTSANDLILNSSSVANLSATVEAGAAAAGIGAVGVGVAIGAALAENFIGFDVNGSLANSEVLAYITGSEVLISGQLDQQAETSNTIEAEVQAGSVAAAVGVIAAAGAGAGVDTINKIGQTAKAFIQDTIGRGVLADSARLRAVDQSSIATDAEASSIAGAIGLGGAVSVSVTLAENTVTNVTESYVKNADFGALFNWEQNDGVQLLGIGDRVRRDDGKVFEFQGETSDYLSTVGNVVLGLGKKVTVAPGHSNGGAVGQIYEYLGRPSSFNSSNGEQTVKPGDRIRISVSYDKQLALPGGVYEYLGDTTNVINLSTTDYINELDGNDEPLWREASHVDLSSENYSDTDFWANVSSVDLRVSNFNQKKLWTEIAGSFSINAEETATLSAEAKAASFSGGLFAASGGGANSLNTIQTVTKAYIESSNVSTSGDLSVNAIEATEANTVVGTESIAGGLISIAAGGSVAVVELAPTVSSDIKDTLVHASDVDVKATATPQSLAHAYGVNAGTLAVGASIATILIAPEVTAGVGGSHAINADSLHVNATLKRPATGKSGDVYTSGSSGGLIGVNSTTSTVSNSGTVQSHVRPSSDLNVAGRTQINASSFANHRANADSFAGGLIAAGISKASATSTANVQTNLGANTQIDGGSLIIGATRDHDQFADVYAGSGGAIAGASA
ncbi:MAG: hypothetical protein CMM07_12785, partial [Rhodopirellula sp.]|nr:hypothetical protein [Rhodopirellula sp.]